MKKNPIVEFDDPKREGNEDSGRISEKNMAIVRQILKFEKKVHSRKRVEGFFCKGLRRWTTSNISGWVEVSKRGAVPQRVQGEL